jgi:hypothetical protein
MEFKCMRDYKYLLAPYEQLHEANEIDLDYEKLRWALSSTIRFNKPAKLEPKGTFWGWDKDVLPLLRKYKEHRHFLKFAGSALLYYIDNAGYTYGVLYATENGLYWYAEANDELDCHIYCEHRVKPKQITLET